MNNQTGGKSIKKLPGALMWMIKPSISGRHNNPMENATAALKAIEQPTRRKVRYEDYLAAVEANGGDVDVCQRSDLAMAHKMRQRYLAFFLLASLTVTILLPLVPDQFGELAWMLVIGPLLSLVGAILISDRMVVICSTRKHMSMTNYLLGGFRARQ